MSSSDGFCSTLAFRPGELGDRYTGLAASTATTHPPIHQASLSTSSATSSSQLETPSQTPSLTNAMAQFAQPQPSRRSPAPISTQQQAHAQLSSSLIRSPANSRSNSVSSIASHATQASQMSHTHSFALGAGAVGNSPAPTMGTVPGLTASSSSGGGGGGVGVGGLLLSTPPMTPSASGDGRASFSGRKREARSLSQSETEGTERGRAQDGRSSKRRRIAPTAVPEGERG